MRANIFQPEGFTEIRVDNVPCVNANSRESTSLWNDGIFLHMSPKPKRMIKS